MKLRVYVADLFDTLQSGKTIAMGLFPDRVVMLHNSIDGPDPSAELPFGFPLSFLLSLEDLVAPQLQGKCTVIAPDGERVLATSQIAATLTPGTTSMNIVLKVDPLLVPAPGHFTVRFESDDGTVEDHFEVRISRVPGAQALVAVQPAAAQKKPAAAKHKPRRRAEPAA